jgi:hypothetical protein
MPQINTASLHNSISEPYTFAVAGVFGGAGGVTAPPKHKGFMITTGATTGSGQGYNKVPFDVLFKTNTGITFFNRITVAIGTSMFLPLNIAGVSGSPNQNIDATYTGLAAHTLTYFF